MTKPSNIRELLELWPSRQAIAADMTQESGPTVGIEQIAKWVQRGTIPAKYHYHLWQSAIRRALPVTPELIIRVHAATTPAADTGNEVSNG